MSDAARPGSCSTDSAEANSAATNARRVSSCSRVAGVLGGGALTTSLLFPDRVTTGVEDARVLVGAGCAFSGTIREEVFGVPAPKRIQSAQALPPRATATPARRRVCAMIRRMVAPQINRPDERLPVRTELQSDIPGTGVRAGVLDSDAIAACVIDSDASA